LLIADEVMTGWGRTGKWFCVDHWDVKPDILVTAKGITSAYVPLGLCATTKAIADHFEENYFAHGHTYEAHPMTLGPAVATIEEMHRLNLVERAASLAPYVQQKLEALKEKHPSVGDVRGKGLFWAVELVKNRETKQPFNTMADKISGAPLVVDQIAAKMMGMGVSQQAWISHFVIAPPLIVTEAELDFGINALDESLGLADALVE
ncbi:MAG TPA: aminotransferase class III-fold pyridoxal phosphate-dependent enzyme, partial [Acidobacteriaceae bacterium]